MHRMVSTEVAGLVSARPTSFRVAGWAARLLPLQMAAAMIWFAVGIGRRHPGIWPGGTVVTYIVVILDVITWMVAAWMATAAVRRMARLAGRRTWAITASRLCQVGFTAATVSLLLPAAFGELSRVTRLGTGWPRAWEHLVPDQVEWVTAMSLAPAAPALLGIGFIGLRRAESVQLAGFQWAAAGLLFPLFVWTVSIVARRGSAEAPEGVLYLLAVALVCTVVSVMHAATWRIAWIHAARPYPG